MILESFRGVTEARIDTHGGMPRLMINGEPVPPVIFFHNTHIDGMTRSIRGQLTMHYMQLQVEMARQAGVHLYSIPFGWPTRADGSPNYEVANSILDAFIEIDPQALFILRSYPASRDWGALHDIPAEEISTFRDGSQGMVSIASDLFWQATDDVLRQFIAYYEASPYAQHILGYHPGGPEHEMFLDRYREAGPDISLPNQRRFRAWLKRHYADDAALRTAWGRPELTFETAEVPQHGDAARFPMDRSRYEGDELVNYYAPDDGTIETFYDLPADQDWIDFSTYSSDLILERIIAWAGIVKQESDGKKLSVFCYGYTFDLPGSFSGHLRLQRSLECPDIDILMAPYSYLDRFAGGAMNGMALADTIAAHGKLWLNEDDMRTSLMDSEHISPDWHLFKVRAKNLHETVNYLERNFAQLLAHRAATWWTDLAAVGTFNHPAVWEMLRQRMTLFDALYANPTPYRPEVAVLVDEEAKLYVKNDTDVNFWTMNNLRDMSVKTGASVGYYSQQDFIQGIVPVCKVYIFANAFRVSDDQIEAIRARLAREAATAIWIYAPGLLGPDGFDIDRTRRLTGIKVKIQNGKSGSNGLGKLAGEHWSSRHYTLIPRLIIRDSSVEPLGHFEADAEISAARVRHGQQQDILIAEMGLTWQVLARLFAESGVHLWTDDGSVIQTDGSFLMIHTATAGLKTIHLPAGVDLRPIKGVIRSRDSTRIQVAFEAAESLWFEIVTIEFNEKMVR